MADVVRLSHKEPEPACHELVSQYLAMNLQDAERLLSYAAEAGIDVDTTARDAVLKARMNSGPHWNEQSAAALLSALTTLATKVKPVTAESLKWCANSELVRATVVSYKRTALWLACVVIFFSLVTFISSAISDAIRKDVDTANALAVKLSDELGPPQTQPSEVSIRGRTGELPRGVTDKDVIKDLQQFAATIRAIDTRARQLNLFAFYSVADPFIGIRKNEKKMKDTFELPSDLPDLPRAAADKISVYQSG